MRNLLALRDEAIEQPDWQTNRRLFIAFGRIDGGMVVMNGWFLDPFLNTIQDKRQPDKAIHLKDLDMTYLNAEWAD